MSGQGCRRFRRKYRLTLASEISRLRRSACRYGDRYFRVNVLANDRDYPRLCITVPRARVRLGVARNQVKRLIRESFRHSIDLLKGKDVLVRVRHSMQPLEKEAVRAVLLCHWKRIHAQCGH